MRVLRRRRSAVEKTPASEWQHCPALLPSALTRSFSLSLSTHAVSSPAVTYPGQSALPGLQQQLRNSIEGLRSVEKNQMKMRPVKSSPAELGNRRQVFRCGVKRSVHLLIVRTINYCSALFLYAHAYYIIPSTCTRESPT